MLTIVALPALSDSLTNTLLLYSSPVQHELREEAETRNLSRARVLDERAAGVTVLLQNEEDAREAARTEDQMVGPWGLATVGIQSENQGGTQDGLGVFGVNMEDGDFHGFRDGGNKAGVDDAEIQLFQPLQQAAHEERYDTVKGRASTSSPGCRD